MENFVITNHPTKKSFVNDGENIKGYWVDSTQMAKFLGKNKSVLIQNILNGTLANDLIYEKTTKSLNFFISIEEEFFDYRDIRLLAALQNLEEEDLIIDEKNIYELRGNRTKVKGVWVNTEILIKLTGKSHAFITTSVKNDSLPHNIVVKQEGRNLRYFLTTSKPSYTKEEALLFFQSREIAALETKINFMNNHNLKDLEKLISNLNPDMLSVLVKLSNLKVEDLEKMFEINKKVSKLFEKN